MFAYSGDREIASDALAEAFAQAIARGDEVRSPEPWIWTAAFRIAAGEPARRKPNTVSNSRGPQTLVDLVEELGPHARAATPPEAAAAGDLVVVSLPPRAYLAVPVQAMAGKPVLDTINYIPERDGRIPELDDGQLSSSEVLQRHLGTAHVVKVFNNITSRHLAALARPAGADDRSALPIAGDDPAAKAAVAGFLDAIGYDVVDAGPLGSGGRRFQFSTRAFVSPYGGLSDERGTPAGVTAIRAAVGL